MRGIDDAAYLREKSYLWAANDTNVRSDYSNETLLYARTCEGVEKKGKEEKKSILYRRPLVFIPVHFACLYVSKFDIDSVCSPSCGGGGGGGGRKKKNVISRMNNLTQFYFSARFLLRVGFVVVGNSEKHALIFIGWARF